MAGDDATFDLNRAFRLGSRMNEKAGVAWTGYDREKLSSLDPSEMPSAPQFGDVNSFDVTKRDRARQAAISGVRYGESQLGYLYHHETFTADRLVFAQGKNIFPEYATPWEQKWSLLCNGGGRFVPVVQGTPMLDSLGMATVIAHRGTVMAEFLACYGTPTISKAGGWVGGIGMVFVHNRRDSALPPGQSPFILPQSNYEVLTAPDGTVLAVLNVSDKEALKDANWIIDMVLAPMLASRLVSLLKYGPQVTSILTPSGGGFAGEGLAARTVRAGRRLFAGPTLEAVAAFLGVDTSVMAIGREAALEMRGIELVNGYDIRTGVAESFYEAQVATSAETQSIGVFRANKQAAIKYMERAAPKIREFKFKSDPASGILTCQKPSDYLDVAEQEYFVVEKDLVARRTVFRSGQTVTEEMRLDNAYWPKQPGQVVHPDGNIVVGDVDPVGVIPAYSPGSQLVDVPENLETGDWMGPHVKRYSKVFNSKVHRDFMLHGGTEAWINKAGGLTDDIAYAVYPDGKIAILKGRAQQQAFFDAYRRQTVLGSYPRPSPGTVVVDELAARRGRK